MARTVPHALFRMKNTKNGSTRQFDYLDVLLFLTFLTFDSREYFLQSVFSETVSTQADPVEC